MQFINGDQLYKFAWKNKPIINPDNPYVIDSKFFNYRRDPNNRLLRPDTTFSTQTFGQPMQDEADKMEVIEDNEDMKMDLSMSDSMSMQASSKPEDDNQFKAE
ncbi:GH22429 [Drosophila grimshawi]|uniref:GH22429 n=1 Tax=Drosophila grimshawi TaxID=7222 RepID=B4K4D5_DROGR|nr:GH22429 [Drosophila grimshawi]